MIVTMNKRSKYARSSTTTAREMLLTSAGRWFSIMYEKQDGSVRLMNCKVARQSGLQGQSRILINERQTGFRQIYPEMIRQMHIGGQILDFTR